ncbi:MAG TPA: TraB/GumN family protein [Sphingomicrobium sp.]|nr:TraB/GumN family protein [Sphingomicrobium sp.]
MMMVLLAAATAAAAPGAPAAAVPAGRDTTPALFMVRDADTTVYIFGTFHALDGRTNWFRNQVREAFNRSDELVLETVIPEGPAPIAMRQPLHSPSVTASASFLATTRMAINAGKSQGMQVGHGADSVLRRTAELEGKKVEGLETLESQFAMFSKMPSSPPPPRPRAGDPVDEGSAMNALSATMNHMQAAWSRGDQAIFVHMLDQLRRNSPDTYRMMFTERNGRWADWIAGRMQTPGVVFVAVGAGHLAGKDSLLVRLAEQGIPSSRLN